MKLFLITLCLLANFSWAENMKAKIGSTFSAPIVYQDKLYFVATSGVLYRSDLELNHVEKLYEGKKQTLGSLTISQDQLFWGDGFHTDQSSTLHIYNLKQKKIIKEISVKGHIERAPFVMGDAIFIALGPQGVARINLKNYKFDWETKQYKNKTIHVDSNLVHDQAKICGTSVYETKAIICFDEKTGKIVNFQELKRNPKSEITLYDHQIIGFATEADLVKNKWDLPSDFFSFNLTTQKFNVLKELRGFNFFAPQIKDDEAFITLSTGDFITLSLKNSKIRFLGEFAEPFINSNILNQSDYCGFGVMGKVLCFNHKEVGKPTFERRLVDTVIGKVSVYQNKIYLPSRVGYNVISL